MATSDRSALARALLAPFYWHVFAVAFLGLVVWGELARWMQTSPQEITRLTDLHHPTKVDTVARALNALGRTLELRVA